MNDLYYIQQIYICLLYRNLTVDEVIKDLRKQKKFARKRIGFIQTSRRIRKVVRFLKRYKQ